MDSFDNCVDLATIEKLKDAMRKEKELDELIIRTEKAESLTHEMLDYTRNMITWIFEMDDKYRFLSLADVEKAERLISESGELLDQYEKRCSSTSAATKRNFTDDDTKRSFDSTSLR